MTPQSGHELDDWAALVAAPVALGSDGEGDVLAVDVPLESSLAFFRLSVTVYVP